MTDYLELLLPVQEDGQEGVLELSGVHFPAQTTLRETQAPGADGSGLAGSGGTQGGAPALDGLDSESLEDWGQVLVRDMDQARTARERAQSADAASPGPEQAEEGDPSSASGHLQEGAGPAPSLFSAGGGETAAGAAALSAAVGRLQRAVQRQAAAETAAEPAAGRSFAPAEPYQPGEDPVLLVDAAFQRDARRYDGALGLL